MKHDGCLFSDHFFGCIAQHAFGPLIKYCNCSIEVGCNDTHPRSCRKYLIKQFFRFDNLKLCTFLLINILHGTVYPYRNTICHFGFANSPNPKITTVKIDNLKFLIPLFPGAQTFINGLQNPVSVWTRFVKSHGIVYRRDKPFGYAMYFAGYF
ncbi:hypothetical protein D3C73_1000370 [compost metagenome]